VPLAARGTGRVPDVPHGRWHDLFVPNDIISTFTDAEDVGHDGNERPTH
jgi:hypothetical protein